MYAAAYVGDKIIDLAGWDKGPAGETSNLSVSYSNQFQSVSYIGGTWGRQFFRPGSMANVSFESKFSLPDSDPQMFQRWISYYMLTLPLVFADQESCTFLLSQPFPGYMGTRQVETATGVGTVTGSGRVAVVITAAGMEASPVTLSVPVTAGETPNVWMDLVRFYAESDASILRMFQVGGTGANITLTRRSPYAAQDNTLNISIGGTGTTATGITSSPTSSNTTACVPWTLMTQGNFYDANVSVTSTQVGNCVHLSTNVIGRMISPT